MREALTIKQRANNIIIQLVEIKRASESLVDLCIDPQRDIAKAQCAFETQAIRVQLLETKRAS